MFFLAKCFAEPEKIIGMNVKKYSCAEAARLEGLPSYSPPSKM